MALIFSQASLGTEVHITVLIAVKIVPRKLDGHPCGGLLRPHEKVDPQFTQHPVCQRKIIGGIRGGALDGNNICVNLFH